MAYFTWSTGSKFLGTNLDSFEVNSILELDHPACISVLQIMSFFPLRFFIEFFGLNQLIFLPKWCHVSFSLDLPLFGLQPLSKVQGPNF